LLNERGEHPGPDLARGRVEAGDALGVHAADHLAARLAVDAAQVEEIHPVSVVLAQFNANFICLVLCAAANTKHEAAEIRPVAIVTLAKRNKVFRAGHGDKAITAELFEDGLGDLHFALRRWVVDGLNYAIRNLILQHLFFVQPVGNNIAPARRLRVTPTQLVGDAPLGAHYGDPAAQAVVDQRQHGHGSLAAVPFDPFVAVGHG
jgi:hypothetical protein